MVDEKTRNAIYAAFQAKQLRVRTVDPISEAIEPHVVSEVFEHHTPHKDMVRITLANGQTVDTTVDHSLFQQKPSGLGLEPVEAGSLQVGETLATVNVGALEWLEIVAIEHLPPHPKTYDLSVPGPQNYLLSNGILAHNSYAIGGISLSLEKSSKYESLKQNAEGNFEKAAEAKARTTKFMRGLKQSRYGMGIRSAFGPHVGAGVLSPRRFTIFMVGLTYPLWEMFLHASQIVPMLG